MRAVHQTHHGLSLPRRAHRMLRPTFCSCWLMLPICFLPRGNISMKSNTESIFITILSSCCCSREPPLSLTHQLQAANNPSEVMCRNVPHSLISAPRWCLHKCNSRLPFAIQLLTLLYPGQHENAHRAPCL